MYKFVKYNLFSLEYKKAGGFKYVKCRFKIYASERFST